MHIQEGLETWGFQSRRALRRLNWQEGAGLLLKIRGQVHSDAVLATYHIPSTYIALPSLLHIFNFFCFVKLKMTLSFWEYNDIWEKCYFTLDNDPSASSKEVLGVAACQNQERRTKSCINSYSIISLLRSDRLVRSLLWRTSVAQSPPTLSKNSNSF